ncbi:MAG: class I SAM-dependent methyltransferase [Gemmatimonadales bacterium]
MTTPQAARAEEARVREAYARRRPGDRYAFSNPAHLFMMQEREAATLALLVRQGLLPLGDRDILEVGCGGGQWLLDFVRWGARPDRLHGVDLLPERIAQARRVCAPAVVLSRSGATALPYGDGTFDLVLQATVFSSILDPAVRRAVALEMLRVLRPAGVVLWYDLRMNNPSNPDVRGVDRDEIVALFPGCTAAVARVTLAPPLARLLAGRIPWLARALAVAPLLRTHWLGVLRRT